ncbi:MAG: NUDIX hydrolase [Pseudomonadota bacterium]
MIEKWTVSDSTHLVSDEWLQLRRDVCWDRGVEIAPYYIFEYRPWVTIIPITPRQELVLIRQYRHGSGQIEIEVPGGNTEPDDTDMLAAAARELLEETGYTSSKLTELGTVSPNTASHNNLSHLILAEDARQTHSQALDESEHIEVFTLPLEQVPELLTKGKLKQAMHVSALYLALTHLGLVRFELTK